MVVIEKYKNIKKTKTLNDSQIKQLENNYSLFNGNLQNNFNNQNNNKVGSLSLTANKENTAQEQSEKNSDPANNNLLSLLLENNGKLNLESLAKLFNINPLLLQLITKMQNNTSIQSNSIKDAKVKNNQQNESEQDFFGNKKEDIEISSLKSIDDN